MVATLHRFDGALRRRALGLVLLTGLLAALAGTAGAQERYQVAPLGAGMGFNPDKALILDTASGHLWLWVESPPAESAPGGRYLIYQGQVRPGKAMGEIIEQQEWPANR